MPTSGLIPSLPVTESFAAAYLEYYRILPLDLVDGRLRVAACGEPNAEALADLGGSYDAELDLIQVEGEELSDAIRRTFAAQETVLELVRNLSESGPADGEHLDDSLSDARDLANQPPVIRFVNLLIREAHDTAASDIHLEATRDGLRVRLRIDGVLSEMPAPPRALQSAVISRIKLLAELDIAERRMPQDGRVRIRLESRELDLRVSTVPTLHGESVVLRLLDRGGQPVTLPQLGMAPGTLETFSALAARPHGIVLATGPTGSGKTTTLYAALGLRHPSSEKIITVEDPVEYHLGAITQVPVHTGIGLSFSTALRSILRQDPDVLMIGEMRDGETAAIACQAAMTGHLVFSTLHTNDAVSALTRLIDLRVEPYLIAATVEGILAQRLVPATPGRPTRYTYEGTWQQLWRVITNTGDTLGIHSYDIYGRHTSTITLDRVRLEGTTVYYQWTLSTTDYDPANRVTGRGTYLSTIDSLWDNQDWDPADTLRSREIGHLYDQAGRDTARVNERGEATTYRYDRLGRLVARRPWADSAAVRDSTVYDLAGNVHQTITRRGTTITHHVDSRNRDTLTIVPGVGHFKRSYGGPQGELTRLWLTSAVDSIGGVNGEVRYGYDSRGRLRADTAYTGSTPRVATYTYDTYERPSTTTDAIGPWSVRYETVRGLADTLITPLADTVVLTINTRGQLESRITSSTGWKMIDGALYKMNGTADETWSTPSGPNGYKAGSFRRVTGDTGWAALSPIWRQQLGQGMPVDTLQDSTAYDAWGRLTRWNGMSNGSSIQAESYHFDRTGNISQSTGAANYDALSDQLRGRVNGAGRDSLRYDHAGNLIQLREASGGIWDYGYDALERLTSVRRNGTLIARYGYDVLGRRIVKRVYSAASGGTPGYLRMVYRGSHVGYETDSAGTIGLTYTWGAGTDQLLAITDGATHYYATTDRLGSVRSLALRDGTWTMTQRFAPYGERMQRDTSASYGLGSHLRYGWTGREWDAETGMSYHRARYFLPTIRRWTQEDPIGYSGGGNLYAYVGGSPLEASDPNGLAPGYGGGSKGWLYADWYPDLSGRRIYFEEYNPWLAVKTGWERDIVFNEFGRPIAFIPNHLSGDRYFMDEGPHFHRLRTRPTHNPNRAYTIEHDPDDWDEKALELVRNAPDCIGNCYVRESEQGGALDFKRQLPERSLWNGGNGFYYERDVVGNSAWGLYSHWIGVPRWLALTGAELQSRNQYNGRPDEPWDQWGIRRGYAIPLTRMWE